MKQAGMQVGCRLAAPIQRYRAYSRLQPSEIQEFDPTWFRLPTQPENSQIQMSDVV